MAAYLIADVDVTDAEQYQQYSQRVPETVAAYGGRYLVLGGALESLEGDFRPKRIVMIEFPDMQAAKAWYASPEYQAILPLRWRNSRAGMFTFVEGLSAA